MFVEHTFLKNSRYIALLQQIERFAITGGTAFILDYGLLIFFTEYFGLNYLWSATLSFTVGVTYVYILSVKWVYRTKQESRRARTLKFVIFIVLAVCGLGINNLVIFTGVEFFGIHYAISKIGATAIVMVFNFITRKLLLEGIKHS